MTRPSNVIRKGVLALSTLAIAGSLAACAEDYGPRPYRYSPYEAGVVAHVDRGVIVGVRPIEFGPGDTAGATVVGGVAGGLVGNAVAGRRDRGAATVVGALGGALLGNAIANDQRHPGTAYTIQLDRGSRVIEIPQADPQPIPNGTRVNVIYEGGRARVVPARGYAPPPPPPGSYPPPPPPPPRY
jgi:outer membrane lipoprotein SlyB